MLVACRLAGLSALEAHYADDNARRQCEYVRLQVAVEGQGAPKDFAQALIWYRKAADLGNGDAQASLGSMYHDGRGVPKDYAQAMVWYRKAADQEGYIAQGIAQATLGLMYEEGEGVPQDYVLAHMWFNLAASSSGATDDASKRRAVDVDN